MNVVEFLEARITEDEAAAEQLTHIFHGAGTQMYAAETWIQSPLKKSRFLAECTAKRAIIKQADEASSDRAGVISEYCVGEKERAEACATDPGKLILEALASVYKDHTDYQQEWDQ